MHMSDALISPAVGGIMWAASAGAIAYSVKKIQEEDIVEQKVPLMGVMGAFVFAGQMINFSIPGTGSSGHICGALILSAMLGRYAGFITLSVILAIQALFFADGGLLALGSNIFNIGFMTCFVAYPLIFKTVTNVKERLSKSKIIFASVLTSTLGLLLGAFCVVLETLFSGKTELPFMTFTVFMLSIHLAIGILEGLISASLFVFLESHAPETLTDMTAKESHAAKIGSKVIALIMISALVCGGFLSWFAASDPDGLEWSVLNTSGIEELEADDRAHEIFGGIQEKTAILPDYEHKESNNQDNNELFTNSVISTPGIIGGIITAALAGGLGAILFLSKTDKRKISINGK